LRKDCENAYKMVISSVRSKPTADIEDFRDLFVVNQQGFLGDTEHKEEYKKYSDYLKETALRQVEKQKERAEEWRALYWDALKLESFWFFESFLLYMEHKRPYEKQFYAPRAKTQKQVVDDLQSLEDSKSQKMYTLSEPSRVGKSTIMVFFGAWICLRHPESHNAMGTHSGFLADHFYKEMLDLLTTPEYCFEELYSYFQPRKKFIEDKSAEKMTISFVSKGDFPTFTFRGIDGTWTGAIDISNDGYLFVDDLVRDRTHSLSPKRMNDTFSEYLNKMVDRKNDGAKEIMIGTLWNVLDPIKRLEDMYKGDDRYVFRRIPALNENNESNFNYDVKGFSTEYYLEMRDKLIRAGNEAEWMAKYQQAPYVREGLLFPMDQLRFFNGILPVDHKFTLVTVCDPAFGGGDSVSMPIGLQDEDTNWIYVVDWYFNSSGVKITIPGVADMIMKHGVKEITIEKNNGGQLYAQQVQEELDKRGYICSCNTKPAPNNISKEDKIKGYEGKIKTLIIFLDGTKHDKEKMIEEGVTFYERSPQYERALEEMSMFVTIGKNDHDDAADSIAQICAKAYGDLNALADVEVFSRAEIGL